MCQCRNSGYWTPKRDEYLPGKPGAGGMRAHVCQTRRLGRTARCRHWRDSRQLAYDFSHFMALVRFGDAQEGLAHWEEILAHEPSFDNFDTIALYRPLARVWRRAYLIRGRSSS